MLWALASLGSPPEPAWLEQQLRMVSNRQAHGNPLPQHLASQGWALARLGHRPGGEWLAGYQRQLLAALPRLQPRELASALWALASLNSRPEQACVNCC
jgi:hypothetical protein